MKKNVDCSKLVVEKNAIVVSDESIPGNWYVSDGGSGYVMLDLSINSSMFSTTAGWGYLATKREAEDLLRRFRDKMCLGNNVQKDLGETAKQVNPTVKTVQKLGSPVLRLEGEVVSTVTARLVSDGSGRVVLQVRTPESPEFRPVARIQVKNGKLAMFRERGVKSNFINTDKEGRIQN